MSNITLQLHLPDIARLNLNEISWCDLAIIRHDVSYVIRMLKSIGLLRETYFHCVDACNIGINNNSRDGYVFRCPNCKTTISIRIGSFFYRSHLSLFQIFGMIFLYNRGPFKNEFLMHELKIVSKETITDWKNFLRDLYINHLVNNSDKIGGAGISVQIDETLMCKRKYGVGRILINQDLWIVGGIDDLGNIFMELTTRRNQAVLTDIITRNVNEGSIVCTDGWRAYRGIERENYLHRVVIHQHQFVADDGTHTNRIEGVWSACKKFYRPISNKRRDLVFSYLAEYIFRRKFKNQLITKTIEEIKQIYSFN